MFDIKLCFRRLDLLVSDKKSVIINYLIIIPESTESTKSPIEGRFDVSVVVVGSASLEHTEEVAWFSSVFVFFFFRLKLCRIC